jgi:hypothetical protein
MFFSLFLSSVSILLLFRINLRICTMISFFIVELTKRSYIIIIFIILETDRRVDPGPGRSGHGTGPGLSKNPSGSWTGETRSTRRVDPGKPDWDPIYFFICIEVKRRRWTSFSLHVFVISPFILASTRANRLQPSISFDTSGFSLHLLMASS